MPSGSPGVYLTTTADVRSCLAEPACGVTHHKSAVSGYLVRCRKEQAQECCATACDATLVFFIGPGPNPVDLHAAALGPWSLQL